MAWTVNGDQLVAPNGEVVRFRFPVKEIAEVDDVLVTLLDVPPDQVMTENVFGVSREGDVIWQIERVPENAANPVNVYTALGRHSGHVISIGNWSGVTDDVDVQSGKVVRSTITK